MVGPEICTHRLQLDPLVEGDAEAMFEYRSDAEVCRYQSYLPSSLADVQKFIASLQSEEYDVAGTWFQLGIRLCDSGRLIGDFGIHFCADNTRQAEIGFTVAPNYQQQGYATEAVLGVLGHLFGPLKKHRIYASVDPRNRPCIALLKRVGMRQEAHFIESLWIRDEWVDDIVFGMLESEWERR